EPTVPLLCEFHAHTTFSDGAFSPAELVDVYGAAGFDVLAITDHVYRSDLDCAHVPRRRAVRAENYAHYLETIETERERAQRAHGMLLIPGLELTYEHDDPRRAAHALALGLRAWIDVDDGLDEALCQARSLGAALVAAHPHTLDASAGSYRRTARFAEQPE